MGIFRKKNKDIGTEEYEKLLKRIIDICADIEVLKGQVAQIQTDYRSLRGKLNYTLNKEQEDINNISSKYI